MEQRYEPPAPFAPPALRTAPLNEFQVLGRTTYPQSPMIPTAAGPPGQPVPPGPWQPGYGWVPVSAGASTAVRRRTVAMVAAVALALLVVIGALAMSNAGPDRHSLSLPETAGAYARISTVGGDHIRSIFGSGAFGAIPASELDTAKVGIYSRGSQSSPSALFVGFTATGSPTVGRQLQSEGADEVTRDVLGGAGASATVRVGAGPLGGALRCGTARVAGLFASVGVWADSDTVGLVVLFDPAIAISTARTGDVTRTFRAHAEH